MILFLIGATFFLYSFVLLIRLDHATGPIEVTRGTVVLTVLKKNKLGFALLQWVLILLTMGVTIAPAMIFGHRLETIVGSLTIIAWLLVVKATRGLAAWLEAQRTAAVIAATRIQIQFRKQKEHQVRTATGYALMEMREGEHAIH